MNLTKTQQVSAPLTDFTGNLSVPGIFQIAEEAVTEFMGELKTDNVTAKRVYNAAWVFVKNRIKAIRNIGWNESCTVVCFFSKITPAVIAADVGIKNAAGELCAYSRIELCALDLQSGRIRRVDTVGIDRDMATEAPLTDIAFTRFGAQELSEIEQIRVRSTSIDFVGHTNNKEYVRFILNTYSVAELKARPIGEMEIAYINQSYENETLTLYKGCGDKDIVEIRKGSTVVAKCGIVRADG